MDPHVNEWTNLVVRWLHVIAGIAWVGHLYFFNFVNAQVMKAFDADLKKRVVPELMPRALYFFRWAAAYTWITGFLLLGLGVYMGGVITTPGSGMSTGLASSIGLGSLIVGSSVYEAVWKSPLGRNEPVAAAVSLVLMVAMVYGLSRVLSPWALHIHLGAIFGTIMAANVWMRIWPAQRKIIAALKGAAGAPDPQVVAVATQRSKHNTYLSPSVLFFMISAHFPGAYALKVGEANLGWVVAVAMVLAGAAIARLLYAKSESGALLRL